MTTTALQREDRMLASSAGICAALVFVVVASSAWLRLAPSALPCAPAGCEGFALADAVRIAHRVAAMGVSVLALLIAALAWKRPARPGRRMAAVAIIALVATLAIVGRQSSGAVHPAITLTNLLGGLSLLALTAGLCAAVRLPNARVEMPAAAASLLLGLAVVTGALVSAAAAAQPLAPAHRVLSWVAMAAWLFLAARARPHTGSDVARLCTAATLAGLGALSVAAPDWHLAAWLHNFLTALAVGGAAIASATPGDRLARRAPAPAEAPARS